MLEEIEAIEFIDELGSGRTLPILVRAQRSSGVEVEVVAKLSAGECGLGGLIREAFCSMLAADLGLPVPEPFLVEFSKEFLEIVPPAHAAARERIDKSVSPTFGTLYVRGLHAYPHERPVPSVLHDAAGEIVAYDGICRNADRRGEKPNCLTDGKGRLVMIDHELALKVDETLGTFFNPYPWQLQGMETLITSQHKHILLALVKGKGASLARLEAAWGQLTSSRFQEYAMAIPTGWDPAKTIINPMVEHLNLLLEHSNELFVEARRILA